MPSSHVIQYRKLSGAKSLAKLEAIDRAVRKRPEYRKLARDAVVAVDDALYEKVRDGRDDEGCTRPLRWGSLNIVPARCYSERIARVIVEDAEDHGFRLREDDARMLAIAVILGRGDPVLTGKVLSQGRSVPPFVEVMGGLAAVKIMERAEKLTLMLGRPVPEREVA